MRLNKKPEDLMTLPGEALLLLAIRNHNRTEVRSRIDQELERRKTYSPSDRDDRQSLLSLFARPALS